MAQEFGDRFEELQESIMEDMRKVYSEKVIDRFLNPRNLGRIQPFDGFGELTGSCGDTMRMYLKVENGRIINATFLTTGCGPSIACGSTLTELVKGKSTTEAQRITQDDILNALGGLPEEHVHCALLATNTLKKAIRDYLAFKKEPWKKPGGVANQRQRKEE